jgi:hypothetical protein
MKRNNWTRRTGVVVTCTALAAGLTLLSPGAAQASVQAEFSAAANASASYTGPTIGGSCALSSAPGSDQAQSSTATFGHGTRSRSVDLDATFASSDNPADTVRVRGHVSSTLTVRKRHRDLTSFDMATGGSVKVTHAVTNSNCAGSGAVFGEMQMAFTEHHKGWFYLTRDTKKPGSITEFVLVNLKNGKLVTLDFFAGTQSHATSRAFLKPGHYGFEIGVEAIEGGSQGIALKTAQPRSSKIAKTLTVHGEFKPKH